MPAHVFALLEENYHICRQRGLAAVPGSQKPYISDQLISRLCLVRDKDPILFYLSGRKELWGGFEAEGEPFYDTATVWPLKNGEIYPLRLRFTTSVRCFPRPILLSDVFDLRDSGLIWTFALQRPTGGSNAMFSISDAEYRVLEELYVKINPVIGPRPPIQEPYRHFSPDLLARITMTDDGSPKYEAGLMALFLHGLAHGRYKAVLGEYADYLAYVPTSFQKEIDALLLYQTESRPEVNIGYGIVELKRDILDEAGLAQLLHYEDWFLKKRVGGDSRAIHTIALARGFREEVVDYVRRRSQIENKPVRLLRYEVSEDGLQLIEFDNG